MNNTIQFILDDKIVEIDFSKETNLKPTTTVLNYLRNLNNHKGVKEGCAEGDCGACTIVLAELNKENKLIYKAVDSCLVFLPMIHGKQLITVENLSDKKNGETVLHPVQKSMVNFFGSQCGYCTPGFIMSLFALYKSHINPGREIIEDALTGNLCRCTGYLPILEAAQSACQNISEDKFSANENDIIYKLKSISKNKTSILLEKEKQIYFHPQSLDDALMLKKHYKNAIVTNGATDIALRQTKKNEPLFEILDISGIREIKNISEREDGYFIGAGVTLESLKQFSESKLPAHFSILKVFGSLQIRNVATIGGNIGSASPIGDLLPVLFVYNAEVIIQSMLTKRDVEINNFIKGYRKTDIQADELITSVFIPKPENNSIIKSYKISKRKDLDISTVSLAVKLILEKKIVKDIILAYGGMAEITKRAENSESYLKNKIWNRENVEEAMKIIYDEFTPLSDARSGSEFRRITAKNLLLKFFIEGQN